jgi:hypothetical protein
MISIFWEITGATYPYHLISETEFFDLIGDSPPRIYWLNDGEVKARWDDDFTENLRAAFPDDSNQKF